MLTEKFKLVMVEKLNYKLELILVLGMAEVSVNMSKVKLMQ